MPRLALLQLLSSSDPETNLSNTIRTIEKAADAGAQIICTHELFNTEYFPQIQSSKPFSHAQNIPGELSTELCQLAMDLQVVIVASTFEKQTEGVYYNTAFVIDSDGAFLGKYRKMHIPQNSLYQEKYYFTQSDDGYQVFDTKLGKLGLMIGWDAWFPEVARTLALMGAEILICPTSIGSPVSDASEDVPHLQNSWKTMLRSHSIANACYLAVINRCGTEDQINFWGKSFVTNESGKLISEAQHEQDAIVYADLNLDIIAQHRAEWPFFRDRRIRSYEKLSKRDVTDSQ